VSEEPQRILQWALLGEAVDAAEGTAVFVWNDERHYVAVNEAACRLVGISREELTGMPVGHLSPGGAAEEMDRVRRSSLLRGSSSFTRRDGERIEIEWVTLHTRVAGLEYRISLVWPTDDRVLAR
jgi:PAS domain S-box-containing protein